MELEHVQADELWVKRVGGKLWLALALAVPTRLWLGGVLGGSRDARFLANLANQVRACARSLTLLVCVDGLAGYPTAFKKAFRERMRTHKTGIWKKVPAPGLLIGQLVKDYSKHRLVGSSVRLVQGTAAEVAAVLARTGSGRQIQTAYIERLNATFRSKLAVLGRRTRNLARQETTLTAGMYLVGCLYNFCWPHRSLRQRAAPGAGRKWAERTPAMAAGLTAHCWTVEELLRYALPPPPWVPPKRRGRPPKKPRPIPWKLRPPKPVPPKRRGRPPLPRGPDGKILRPAAPQP